MAGNGGGREKPRTLVRRVAVAIAATCVAVGVGGPAGADGRALQSTTTRGDGPAGAVSKPRTVVTTDMEQDDLASLIRYMYYTNDVDTEGIVYTASRFHWAGDGLGTEFFLPGREYHAPQTSWRWTGSNSIQDAVIPAYARIYPNLKSQDPAYPSPASLLAKVTIGNVDFEGEIDHDTAGSNLIKDDFGDPAGHRRRNLPVDPIRTSRSPCDVIRVRTNVLVSSVGGTRPESPGACAVDRLRRISGENEGRKW